MFEESQVYTTFGGVDIKASFGDFTFGTLQGVSYSVTREKSPNYVMGSADPISTSRGKRGTAGSMIFLTLDQEALYDYMQQFQVFRKAGDVYVPSQTDIQRIQSGAGDIYSSDLITPHYPDQLPPFNITLTAQNETMPGGMAMRIFDVDIISNGSGVSVDDLNIEEQMTFICRGISGWRRIPAMNAPAVQTATALQ